MTDFFFTTRHKTIKHTLEFCSKKFKLKFLPFLPLSRKVIAFAWVQRSVDCAVNLLLLLSFLQFHFISFSDRKQQFFRRHAFYSDKWHRTVDLYIHFNRIYKLNYTTSGWYFQSWQLVWAFTKIERLFLKNKQLYVEGVVT